MSKIHESEHSATKGSISAPDSVQVRPSPALGPETPPVGVEPLPPKRKRRPKGAEEFAPQRRQFYPYLYFISEFGPGMTGQPYSMKRGVKDLVNAGLIAGRKAGDRKKVIGGKPAKRQAAKPNSLVRGVLGQYQREKQGWVIEMFWGGGIRCPDCQGRRI